MFLLNTKYDNLFKQLKYIEERFSDCNNSRDCTIYYNSYKGVKDVLEKLTQKPFYIPNTIHDKCLKYQVSEYSDWLIESRDNNFIKNKDYHLSICLSAYFKCSSILGKVLQNPEADILINQKNYSFDNLHNEDREAVLGFLSTENKLLLKYYLEMESNGLFYPMPKGDFFDVRGGITVFNSVGNCCNLLLKSTYSNLFSLEAIPHEFGHVFDFFDYRERFSLQGQGLMTMQGIYGEVLSSYYEQKFLEYYLEQDNHQREALLSLIWYFDQRLQYLWDVLVVSMLEDDDIRYVMNHSAYLSDCHRVLVENGTLSYMPDISDESRVLFLDDAMEYGYGFLLTNYLLEHPSSFNDFLDMRNGNFDVKKLESIGVTPKEVSKSLVKRSEKIFGRYL